MKKVVLILTILVLLVFLAIGAGIFFRWNTPYYEREGASTADNVPSVSDDALAALNGKIRGSLGYPSEFIPPMEVCAENIQTKEEFCTYEQLDALEFTYRIGYEVKVPEGSYHVFARLYGPEDEVGEMAGFKAYYSEFVTCGMDFECPSHSPVEVTVKAGETVGGIDPIDWYPS